MNFPPRKQTRFEGDQLAFTLVELLSVVAIMAIVLGVLGVSLSQSQGRGVQMAAAQVASGMGVARQTSIARNTDALFIIAPQAGGGATSFLPAEPFRYWAVVYSNRGDANWTLATDWTQLPSGTVFMGLVGQGHNPINWSTDGVMPAIGVPFTPRVQASTAGDWQVFNNFTNITVDSIGLADVPFIGFRSSGRAFAHVMAGVGSPPTQMAVILAEGSVFEASQLVLRSTNNITHVETDSRSGRIIVRPRDSYR
jgi:prepilin-type N-terminal cleavage/methylation domain-containing protein